MRETPPPFTHESVIAEQVDIESVGRQLLEELLPIDLTVTPTFPASGSSLTLLAAFTARGQRERGTRSNGQKCFIRSENRNRRLSWSGPLGISNHGEGPGFDASCAECPAFLPHSFPVRALQSLCGAADVVDIEVLLEFARLEEILAQSASGRALIGEPHTLPVLQRPREPQRLVSLRNVGLEELCFSADCR